jgi:RNA polymerase sigma factor (sigma-70 family)
MKVGDTGLSWEQIATGPAHTHRIPRPVLMPRQGSGHAPLRGVLVSALRPAGGGGVLRRPADGFPRFLSQPLGPTCPRCLVRSAPRCRDSEPAGPYLRRCISGALQHHLRDRVRLVRVPRRLHEQGQCPLRHISLDASTDGEPCLLDRLAAPEAEPAISEVMNGLALEQLVYQLPAAEATALWLTVLEGLSLRQTAERLEISCMSVQRAKKKALAALRQQLSGGG